MNKSALTAAALLLAVGCAKAGLLGSQVTSKYYFNGGVYPLGALTFTADGIAHNINLERDYFTVAVDNDHITYDFKLPDSWNPSRVSLERDGLYIKNGNLLTFEGSPDIKSVRVNPATNMAGFSLGNVSFNAREVAVDWASLGFNDKTVVVLDVSTVPEPGTYVLMLAGLATVAVTATARARRQ